MRKNLSLGHYQKNEKGKEIFSAHLGLFCAFLNLNLSSSMKAGAKLSKHLRPSTPGLQSPCSCDRGQRTVDFLCSVFSQAPEYERITTLFPSLGPVMQN